MNAADGMADPAWVAAREAEDREIESDEAAARKEQAPLLADLAAVGVDVSDVWDLVNTPEPCPDAIPVLVEHRHGDYDEGNREGIARALAVTDAAPYWDEVIELFRASNPNQVRLHQGLGVVLAGMAIPSLLPQVREALRDRSLGPNRTLFFRDLGTTTVPGTDGTSSPSS